MHRRTTFLLPLTLAASLLGFGCQQPDDIQVRAAEIANTAGVKVTITNAGELSHDKAQAIAQLLEAKGHDVGAVEVRMKKDVHDAGSLDIELWGTGLPSSAEIPGILTAGVPELASATIQVSDLAPGTGPAPIAIETPGDDLSPDEVKLQILDQLQAQGVEGNVDVIVEDDDKGRRVEVRVEKTEAE